MFAHSLAPYPVRKPARLYPTFQERGEAPPPHIPAFLPVFPDKHTYVATPVFPGHEENPEKQSQVRCRVGQESPPVPMCPSGAVS